MSRRPAHDPALNSPSRSLLAVCLIVGCYDPADASGTQGGGTAQETGTEATAASAASDASESDASAESESGETTQDATIDPMGSTSITTSATDVDATGEDTETGEVVDTTPPQIVSISPELGEAGVTSSASIVVTFDEPMDTVATAAAFASSDLGEVTASWSADDTVLTIDPVAPLAHAEGTDPDDLDALEYTFSISVAAADVAGNPIETELASSFFTARRISATLPIDPALTGAVLSSGVLHTGSGGDALAGDGSDNVQRKGFITLSLVGLPALAQIESATLDAQQYLTLGTPFADLGALSLDHITAETLDADAFGAVGLAELGVFSDVDDDGARSADITAALAADLEAGRPHSQYRLEFAVATDGDGSIDRTRFDAPGGSVVYLVE